MRVFKFLILSFHFLVLFARLLATDKTCRRKGNGAEFKSGAVLLLMLLAVPVNAAENTALPKQLQANDVTSPEQALVADNPATSSTVEVKDLSQSAANGDIEKLKKLYTRKGADTCLKCHDQDYAYPVLDIFYSKHGNRNDPRTPMAQLQCETCHGPGRAHATEPNVGQQRAPILSFSERSSFSVEQQNAPCLRCHQNAMANWQTSTHQRQQLRCTSCHQIHAKKDPILQVKTQANTCYQCHLQQRSEFQRMSSHPLGRDGMSCTSCHNPHGSLNPHLLRKSTVNNLCYVCHAEKRGPFLWLHAPVQEDCTICHEQHGAAQATLLKQRPPFLCQSCHSMAGHPSLSFSGSDNSASFSGSFLLGKSCLNCHFQIHGSNHPAGVKFMR